MFEKNQLFVGAMGRAVARAYNGGLGAEPPAGYRSRAPGQGVRGAKPLWNWITFGFCTFSGSCKFVHFSLIWKRKEIRYLCYLWKNHG